MRGVVVRQSGGAFHLADDRMKGTVRLLRRAEIAQARVGLAREAFQQRRRETRFTDARLAGEEHHLSFAGFRLGPTPQQQFKFFFPPNEGRQADPMQRVEAAFKRTRPQRRPGSHRPGDALEVLGPEVPQLEEIAEKPSRAIRDDDHVRRGHPLQARRKVGCLGDDRLLLSRPVPIRSPTTTSPVAMPIDGWPPKDRDDNRRYSHRAPPPYEAPKKDFLIRSTTRSGFSNIKKCPPSGTYSIA